MKTIKYSTLVILLSLCVQGMAQRHIRGQRALEAAGGITGKGFFISSAFSKYLQGDQYIKVGLLYDNTKLYGMGQRVYVHSFFADGSFQYTFLKLSEAIFINALAGGSVGYEVINENQFSSEAFSINSKSKFVAGIFMGVEGEVFLSNKLALIGNFNQRLYFLSDLGRWRFYGGGGIKYLF